MKGWRKKERWGLHIHGVRLALRLGLSYGWQGSARNGAKVDIGCPDIHGCDCTIAVFEAQNANRTYSEAIHFLRWIEARTARAKSRSARWAMIRSLRLRPVMKNTGLFGLLEDWAKDG